MDAIDFVKRHGAENIKRVMKTKHDGYEFIHYTTQGVFLFKSDRGVPVEEINKIIEAHDLISYMGGMHMVIADMRELDGYEVSSPYWMTVKEALELVELCDGC